MFTTMTLSAVCFVWLGAGVLSAALVRFICWVDTPPKKSARRIGA